MLEFILGRACTGKTYEVIKRVAEASKSGRVVLIVPEQFSFESERSVIKYEDAVSDNISVLSFSRLYDDFLERSGKGAHPVVSDFEKIILMKKALKGCCDNLKVFSKYVEYRDFCVSISDTIRDFKFAGVTSKELADAANLIGGSCGAKLNDIALVMDTFDALLYNKYIDPSDKLTKLYYDLAQSDYFKDTTVFFDSYSGFTGQQYKIIERVLEQADNTVFSFCADEPSDESLGVFHNVNQAIRKIISIAKSRNIREVKYNTSDNTFYSNQAMKELERVLTSKNRDTSCSAEGKIRILSCSNPREEALAAANIISKEVYENGYRFKDFIVVARNAEDYANYVARQCEQNSVACFMDKSVKLSATPLYIYLHTLFETVKSLTTENILKLVKLGLLDIKLEDISEIEDYAFVWDVKGSDWKNEWIMNVNGLHADEAREHDKEKLRCINLTRDRIISMLSGFKHSFNGTAKQRVIAVYKHLKDNNVDKNLGKLCDEFENDGDNYYSSILTQSWDNIMSVFDSICRVLDDGTEISNAEFEELFVIAASACEISNIPQMLDEVTFGAADRIRPSKPKVSIILGANQGIFPKHSNKSGILRQSDKDKLSSCGIMLDDTIKGAIEENYLVYSMLCCPVDKVYVLYSKMSMSGDTLEPSSFINIIKDSFSDLKTEEFSLGSSGEFVPRTHKAAFNEVGAISDEDALNIKASLSDNSEYYDRLEAMDSHKSGTDFSLSPERADALFGKNINISATKFDTYHKCSLSYLLKNGLRLKKLQRADLNVLQRGTIAHYVLETMITKYKGELKNLTMLQISSEVDLLVHKYISLVQGSEVLMTSRFAFLLEKISASVKEIVYHISQEFAQSDFSPEFCELTIGADGILPRMEYVLSDGARVSFEGKIDRVDVYKNKVRVVDYKTGRMTFTLSDTLVGLNMQMLLYLYAFVKNGDALVDNPEPAGILYMPAKTSKTKKSLKMNGLIVDNDEVVTAMEKDNGGVYIPKYSPSSENFIDSGMFDLIFQKIDELIVDMGDSVRKGEFSANPTDSLSVNACAYCDYAAICRSSQNEHRQAVAYTNDEIREIMKRGEEGGV